MVCQWVAISLVLFICNAQEQLTCLRTDDVFNSLPPSAPLNSQQGRPGRRGPHSPRGISGLSRTGMKGEPGILNISLVHFLRDNFTRALLRGFVELDDGWIAPFNGYQYKTTPNCLNWTESRINCKVWGGDLIDYGFRDFNIIKKISRGLAFPSYPWYWIGLSNEASEDDRDWHWVNGGKSRLDDASLWLLNEPSGIGNQTCAMSYMGDNHRDAFRVWNFPCSARCRAICEKLIVLWIIQIF